MIRPDDFFHPEMKPILNARRLMPPAETPEERKQAWIVYTRAISPAVPDSFKVVNRTIPANGVDVPVRIYYPPTAPEKPPCIIYMHGGGWMLGNLDTSETQAWGISMGTGAVLVSVDYRLCPEFPFPAAFDDCYGVFEWVSRNGAEIGIDPPRIAVCGESAGGNLTAALALAARDRDGPLMRAQGIIYPATGEKTDLPSYVEYKDGPALTTERQIYYNNIYYLDGGHGDNPYAAPAMAKDFSNLPPAFIHTAECDPLRDDGRYYAAKLAMAGNQVVYREAKRMLHGFLRSWNDGPAVKAEYDALCGFLREHLN